MLDSCYRKMERSKKFCLLAFACCCLMVAIQNKWWHRELWLSGNGLVKLLLNGSISSSYETPMQQQDKYQQLIGRQRAKEHDNEIRSNYRSKYDEAIEEVLQEIEQFRSVRDKKTILYWTPAYEAVDFHLGLGTTPFEDCAFSECEATADKSRQLEADALLFHGTNIEGMEPPLQQPRDQVWMFAQKESPYSWTIDFGDFGARLNATMTYRSDSDIPWRYVNVQPKLPSERWKEVPQKNFTSSPTVAWIVSHCTTKSKREEFVKRLKEHIQVDIYGKCSREKPKRLCPDGDDGKVIYRCYEHISEKYLFYLSLENSLCTEYITEKFGRPLQYGLVPIVMGASKEDYARVAPPNSFIHVDDFASAEELAEYLEHLRTHPEEYYQYLEWRHTHSVVGANPQCQLCQLMHQQNRRFRQNGNVHTWWNSACHMPQQTQR